MKPSHTPVLTHEVVSALQVRPLGKYIDCNVGEGGHSQAILSAVAPGPRLLGIDLDTEALMAARSRLGTHGERVALAQGNFADLGVIAEGYGFSPADGVLFDLGISSLQVDTPERGFSFRWEARLDMRFDIGQETTAHDVVNGYPEESLANVIFRLGEERRARRIARAIVRRRPIETTTQLADVVTQALGKPGKSRTHPATRTFQAIRMAVNQELENLEQGLEQSLETLGSGGRLVVISYHSLEDRLVKNKLRREASECVCPPKTPMCVCGHTARIRLVNRRMKRPTLKEVQANPRSRSARMRVAARI